MAETVASGVVFGYPLCGWWGCDDPEDWETARPGDPEYPGAKRERRIARYHEPRAEWEKRLWAERDKRNHGDPLWWGA